MADRNDTPALRAALPAQRFEVVYDNVYDWERGTTAEQVEATRKPCGDRLSGTSSCRAWRPMATG